MLFFVGISPNRLAFFQVTITAVSGKQLSITPALKFMHFGEITFGVDERAEVGLLTRSIVIEGAADEATPNFGGHIMMMEGFVAAHIEGVELVNMGQGNNVGRYPVSRLFEPFSFASRERVCVQVHFHMCDTTPEGTYVKDNSIVHSNFRCVVVHGSHGVLVQGNVAYDHFGHCFFLGEHVRLLLRASLF